MKRDMDLARRILLAIEADSTVTGGDFGIPLEFEGVPQETISYHVKLLERAGLIEATDLSDSGEFLWMAQGLTWEGHEFLDAARESGRWEKAKQVVLEKTGGLSFDVLKALLTKWAQDAMSNVHLPL